MAILKKKQLGALALANAQRKKEFVNNVATGAQVLAYRVYSPSMDIAFTVSVKDLTPVISGDDLENRNEVGDFVKVLFDDLELKSWIRDNQMQATATASRARILNSKEGVAK